MFMTQPPVFFYCVKVRNIEIILIFFTKGILIFSMSLYAMDIIIL